MSRPLPLAALIAISLWAGAAVTQARGEPATCDEGQVVAPGTRDHCCWPGQRWAKRERRCVGAPAACPVDHHGEGERCVLDEEALPRRLREAIRRGVPAVRRCHEKALELAPDLVARVGPKLTIAADGRVKRVVLESSLPTALAACITTAIKGWRFPPLPRDVEISYPTNVDPAN